MKKRIHPNRWLWWAALYILIGGAGLILLMYYTNPGPPVITDDMRLVALGTVVGVGLCVISATSHLWIRR